MNEIAVGVVARLVFGWLRDNNFLKAAISLEEQYGMSLGDSSGLNLQTRLTILEHISSLFENQTTTSNVQAKVKPPAARTMRNNMSSSSAQPKPAANPKSAAREKNGAATVVGNAVAATEQQNDVVITKTTTAIAPPLENKKTLPNKKTEKKIDLLQIAERVHEKQNAARNQKKNVEKVERMLTDSVDRNLSKVFQRQSNIPEWATFANANQANPSAQETSSTNQNVSLSVISANKEVPLSIVDIEEQARSEVEATPVADNPLVASPDVSAVTLNYSSDSSSDSSNDEEDGFQLKMTNGKRVPFVHSAGKKAGVKNAKQIKGKSGEEEVLEMNSITDYSTMNGTNNQCIVVENGESKPKKNKSNVTDNVAEVEESASLRAVEEVTTNNKPRKKKRSKSESEDVNTIPAEEVPILDSQESTKKKRKKKKNHEERPAAEEQSTVAVVELESEDTQDDFRSPPKKKKKKKNKQELEAL